MFLLYIIFIFFSIGGIIAFLSFSVSPVWFWLEHGYWSLADPPKMIILGTCFLAIHGAVGIGGLLYLHKTIPEENVDLDTPSSESLQKPWTNKTYWNKAVIPSKKILRLDIAMFMTRYFSTISIFPLFAIAESIKLIDYTALIGLVFPMLALCSYWQLKKMQEQPFYYEPLPLSLSTYPVYIGESCQGFINFPYSEPSIQSSFIELQCSIRKQAGDDYEQDRLWYEKQEPIYVSSKNTQTFSFNFDLKHGLKEAQPAEEYPSISWEMHLTLTLNDNSVVKREYHNIPVFKKDQPQR